MNILHISTHNENCGIGKYQEQYLKSFAVVDPTAKHAFFQHSPNQIKKMTPSEVSAVLNELKQTVMGYDLVHVQHELSFYSADFLESIVSIIKGAGLPLVSTIHTKVIGSDPVLGSRLSPFYWRRKVGAKLANDRVIRHFIPLAKSDITIVHNTFTKRSLEEIGFKASKITVLPIPVPIHNPRALTNVEKQADDLLSPLHLKNGDILLATAGYLNGVKGTLHAVKAMIGLPENYKLAIIGGLHPQSKDEKFLDEIADYIYRHKLSERVYITGSPDDNTFNAAINKADIMLYPYLRLYSSSSAALNNALSLGKPIIAFPAMAFVEINKDNNVMDICESFSYYDLIKKISQQTPESLRKLSNFSEKYARKHSYDNMAKIVTGLYKKLLTRP